MAVMMNVFHLNIESMSAFFHTERHISMLLMLIFLPERMVVLDRLDIIKE
jgi:hypothetical protein